MNKLMNGRATLDLSLFAGGFIDRHRKKTIMLVSDSIAAAVYGMYAFVKRDIGNYMLLKVHFVFFDYNEPFFFFLLDYIAVMGLFIFIGHCLAGF